MEDQLPFFNFSLKRVIALQPDSFKKAKIKIVFAVLIIALIKVIIVFFIAMHYMQYRQLFRAAFFAVSILVLIKVLLYRPSSIKIISRILMAAALATVWSNIFVYAQHINITTMQFIYMVALVSYYLIGGIEAAAYTFLGILPVFLYWFTNGTIISKGIAPQELALPGAEIVIVLNFFTFGLSHYLYYKAFHQNLREKEALNERLEANILEVRALAESRSVFLSTMSHELRTPLNGVIGMTHLLKDSAYEEQKENFEMLEFSATNLLAVINDILDFNKSELDKIELEVIPVNLYNLLQKICYGMEVRAAQKSLTWKLEIDEQLRNLSVITDPTRLTQIIYNLAGNAIKFTEKGTITVKVKVLNEYSDKIRVEFSIIDTGIGIAADRHEQIFNPFIQASANTTRHFGGTGLGLAIVKRLLRLFNSDISLESELANGSTFSFIILFNLYHEESSAIAEVKKVKTDMKGLRVLIVEDNQINILVLEKLLSKWEIQTVTAKNGKLALGIFFSDTFDVILMDLHMPVMDGYEAAKAIRGFSDKVKASVPIIAITASVSRNVNARIKEMGINDYLPKPFQADQLYEKLQQIYISSR